MELQTCLVWASTYSSVQECCISLSTQVLLRDWTTSDQEFEPTKGIWKPLTFKVLIVIQNSIWYQLLFFFKLVMYFVNTFMFVFLFLRGWYNLWRWNWSTASTSQWTYCYGSKQNNCARTFWFFCGQKYCPESERSGCCNWRTYKHISLYRYFTSY